MTRLILASQSPRRKELLEQAGIPFHTISSQVEEKTDPTLSPEELVVSLAMQKAEAVFKKNPENVVLGSDTVVSIDGRVLGKPSDKKEARDMLRMLSGRTHEVFTGVAVLSGDKTRTVCEKASVQFYDLSDEEIDGYIKSGEPFDKAGSYGIQGLGAVLVERISGDYFAIVGLPLAKTIRVLREFDIVGDWQA
ncbi:septum formation inhibitor Maf [Bacillus sp. H-16]|uniref:Maf family protein n=1 Tax=Alteribacter salitolerans TaxID=2912333 RepID=UPI001964BD5C|nr:Maf family protein [Alteribacter salitolerans]MBM7097997.1 septum formation inhibitor Maf [Alteribacter salitolerans]